MRIAIGKETVPGETRVALVVDAVKRLIGKGWEVHVQSGAGEAAGVRDEDYRAAGATIELSPHSLYAHADVIAHVRPPASEQVRLLPKGAVLVGLLNPLGDPAGMASLAAQGVTAISVDLIPRTTLAQMMDVLSSQASVAGYRAVLLAAQALPRFFPMMMTAAGTISPARVLVLGAGVAGLQAIATSRRLGAVVEAFDVRRVVKEQVESLGAQFIEVPSTEDAQTKTGYARELSEEYQKLQRALLKERLAKCDVCITTALIPGKRAPILVTTEMVRGMRRGSVIVDLAAEQGGNCELTRPNKRTIFDGVTIIGEVNLPAQLPVDASQMYSRNVEKLLAHLYKKPALDLEDEITRAVVVTRDGAVVNPRVVETLPASEVASRAVGAE